MSPRRRPSAAQILMRSLGMGLLIVVCGALAIASRPLLVGLWLSDSRSEGGIGNDLELTANGTIIINFGVAVAVRYEIQERMNDTFVVHLNDPKEGHIQSSEISIKKNKLVQRDLASGERLKMKRVGDAEDANLPFVGRWAYRHPAGADALTDFTDDGIMLLRIPTSTAKGTYRIEDDEIHLEWGAAEPPLTALHWEAGGLVAELSNGEQLRFHRLGESE